MTRSWHGPHPTEQQRRLLRACLDPDERRAAAEWQTWHAEGDFDEEDPASHELASLAAVRLGSAAAGEAEAARSLGWHRRAWYLSALAADAAARIGRACEERGLVAIALGDLAGALQGVEFAGRRLPIRAIEVALPAIDREARMELLSITDSGAVGEAIRSHRLRVALLDAAPEPLADLECQRPLAGSAFALPSHGSMLARLAARNWCWSPPDRLRWMIEAMAILGSHPQPVQLGEQLHRSLASTGGGRSAELALRALRSLLPRSIDLDRLDGAIEAAAEVRGGPRERLRAWVRRHPPHSPIVRGHRTLGRWLQSVRARG